MTPSPAAVQHALDRLVVGRRRIFGWGWAAHPTQAVTKVHLRASGEGWEKRIRGDMGLSRDDVSLAFPDFPGAATSGFVVTGYIESETPSRFELEFELADGTSTAVDVSAHAEARGPQRKARQLGWVLRSVWRRVRQGDFAGILRRARAQHFTAPTVDDAGIVQELLPLLREAPRASLVLDHNMGGGANKYRREHVERRLAAGETVLLVTYNLPMLEYRLHLLRPGEPERVFAASSFTVTEALFGATPIAEVFVNSPVSFHEPLLLADWLAGVRERHPRVRLVITMHDYFAICPSFVLLDADGRHCGIPSPERCDQCLPRHDASYVALSPPTRIGPWRSLWGRCLVLADEVRCFSGATRELLFKAYPQLPAERVTVVPHRVEFAPTRLPRVRHRAPLVIGVVGEISAQKGAQVVARMLQRLDREGGDTRIVVVGTLDLPLRSPRLTVTGRYDPAQLPDLVEAHGVNLVFFPSIWPETFSYVVAEVAALGMPIVAFDLGAPAERLRGDPRARLVAEVDADAALDTIQDFHAELARGERSAA